MKIPVPFDEGEKTVDTSIRIIFSSYIGPANFKIGAVFSDLSEAEALLIESFVQRPPI